jgi:excisionase family DNA binding protein
MDNLELAPIIVSVAEAAKLLSCSRNHVYRLLEGNELPTVQLAIGRSMTRIRTSDIEAFINARTF